MSTTPLATYRIGEALEKFRTFEGEEDGAAYLEEQAAPAFQALHSATRQPGATGRRPFSGSRSLQCS